MPVITRFGGGTASTGLPEFTYTGTYQLIDDGNKNWRIKFLTSGTFTPKKAMTADVFLVGGGGGGGGGNYDRSSGGGGGYTLTVSYAMQALTPITIAIGAGGAQNADGGATSFATITVFGGHKGYAGDGMKGGGAGGSGGGASDKAGGTDGASGGNYSSSAAGGAGQGVTTREFGNASGALYAAGGGGQQGVGGTDWSGVKPNGGSLVSSGSGTIGISAVANTGSGGGGGGRKNTGGSGGSGIVIIRNMRAA